MNNQIANSIQAGLKFLASNQTAAGNYKGLASPRPIFYSSVTTDTIFFSSLVLDCLKNVEGSSAIRRKLSEYLLSHASASWSWNYWERGSSARPYPDDLDDTACTLAGLIGYDASSAGVEVQAKLAQHLIACEVQPGGPYRTWFVATDSPVWRDVDPVVNANVGYVLSLLNVHSQPLEDYLSTCIEQNNLQSPYYVGVVPTLYFLTRWYKGPQLHRLRELIVQQLDRRQSVLQQAMLVTAACRLGDQARVDSVHIRQLLKSQRHGGWPANPLYYEPPEDGVQHYAGSPELTTAFALEALVAWQTTKPLAPAPVIESIELKDIYKDLLYAQQQTEIIDIAGVIKRAGHWKIPEPVVRRLNRGSRNGWLAYSIYDDFLDEEGQLKYLNVANMAMRLSVNHFKQAVDSVDYHRFIDEVFTKVDAANTWELMHARNLDDLPSYGAYARLVHRSWGHILAPTGVLLAAGFDLHGSEIAQLHDFFRHYIIAKQLCDDAHDWLDDMRRGHATAVVALLIKRCPDGDDTARQAYFWQHTIDEVNALIRRHLQSAQIILDSCTFFVQKDELQAWLNNLELACRRAEEGREQALQFIETFTTSNLV